LLTCANVTHAAAQLSVTQSAMSRNLSLLRDHLGDPLLIREGTRYLLTDRAKQLLPRLHSLMFDIKELFSGAKFDPAGCRRSFVMASSDYVAQYIFPSIVDAIHRVAPQVQLHYRMMESPMLEELGTLPVDLVATLVPESPENLYGRHLGSDYPVCVMAENHPLAGKEGTKTLFWTVTLQSMGVNEIYRLRFLFFLRRFRSWSAVRCS